MSEQSLETIEARIAHLEKRNRWLCGALGAMIVAAAVEATVGNAAPTTPRTIEAEQFVVRDAKGRSVATFGSDVSGNTGLAIDDATGKTRLALGLKSDGTTGLVLNDVTGDKRASLATQPSGKAGLSLFGPQGRIRAGIGINEQGVPTAATIPPAPAPLGAR